MCAHILVIDSIKQPDGYIAFKNSNSDFFEILIVSLINKKSKKKKTDRFPLRITCVPLKNRPKSNLVGSAKVKA